MEWLGGGGASLPDGNTGVMGDPAGHEGFSSFDDALVLRRRGDPGPS